MSMIGVDANVVRYTTVIIRGKQANHARLVNLMETVLWSTLSCQSQRAQRYYDNPNIPTSISLPLEKRLYSMNCCASMV